MRALRAFDDRRGPDVPGDGRQKSKDAWNQLFEWSGGDRERFRAAIDQFIARCNTSSNPEARRTGADMTIRLKLKTKLGEEIAERWG